MNTETPTSRNESWRSQPLSEIEPITEGGFSITTRDQLDELVELPVLEACKVLFDKGISTVQSSANYTDLERGFVYILIDASQLSLENRHIAENMGLSINAGNTHIQSETITLTVPVSGTMPVGDISDAMLEKISAFKNQLPYGREKVMRDQRLYEVAIQLDSDVLDRNIDFSEGDIDAVKERVELLKYLYENIDFINDTVLGEMREFLDQKNISRELTGKFSLYLVGGRVAGTSKLKATSDIDLVITSEKPFTLGRNATQSPEVLSSLPPLSEESSVKGLAEAWSICLDHIAEQLDIEVEPGSSLPIGLEAWGIFRDIDMPPKTTILIGREK